MPATSEAGRGEAGSSPRVCGGSTAPLTPGFRLPVSRTVREHTSVGFHTAPLWPCHGATGGSRCCGRAALLPFHLPRPHFPRNLRWLASSPPWASAPETGPLPRPLPLRDSSLPVFGPSPPLLGT